MNLLERFFPVREDREYNERDDLRNAMFRGAWHDKDLCPEDRHDLHYRASMMGLEMIGLWRRKPMLPMRLIKFALEQIGLRAK